MQISRFNSSLNFILAFLLLPFTLVFNASAQEPVHSKFIITDQFGYRPLSQKTAVIRNPQAGYDSLEVFIPGSTYALVEKETSEQVFSGTPVTWKNGLTDASSGDKVWWFDFSSVTAPGTYYVLDVDSNLRSYEFEIREDIYQEVMVQALRTFFYQRSGFEKQPPFACEEWADGASHMQDKKARDFLSKSDASTERDVSGGWYDAGDFNKYTSWTASYIVDFMKAFIENPGVWGDDYNIPESGNNIPDILDEAKWGLDHLLRLQQPDGSMLSVVGAAHASPPSKATGPSYYGRPNTSGTLNAAGAFAIASKVYASVGLKEYADSLKACAIKAWHWAAENPNVIFQNNTGSTSGLAAGQQETNDYGRFMAKMEAAAFLYELTGETSYKSFFESNYTQVHMMQWTFVFPFERDNQETLLYYTTLDGISPSVKSNILNKYRSAMDKDDNFAAYRSKTDPYLAQIKDYTWGSNATKGNQGLIFLAYEYYNLNPVNNAEAVAAAENFVHYIHGVNPFNLVYLSNMYGFGADNSVNEFFHSWFTNGSAKWDRVGTSQYGPAPGFLTGGPNPFYTWDGCCPSGCGSSNNNSLCYSESISPPLGQPKQKSYKDFNTSWPLNSWSVTENSCGYQLNYIRLLARFLPVQYDCSGTYNGTASYDACGVCSGGNTGIVPAAGSGDCVTTSVSAIKVSAPNVFPNPASGKLNIHFQSDKEYAVELLTAQGQSIMAKKLTGNAVLDINALQPGHYIVVITSRNETWNKRFVKL
jgi:endoglucanase